MAWGCATFVRNIGEINKHLKKRKNEITIRSSATEYLTYVAISGDAVEGFFAYCRGSCGHETGEWVCCSEGGGC